MSISGKSKLCLDTKKNCCVHDEAAHILYKLSAQSV